MIAHSVAHAQTSPESSNLLPEHQVFNNWKVVCDVQLPCRMSQTIVQPSSRRLILQVKVVAGENPILLVTFPLGILLSTGWQYDIDQKIQRTQPFEICKADGCHAGIKLTPTLLNALKRGNTMNIRFYDAAQTIVDPQVSLSGFTKAYEALQ